MSLWTLIKLVAALGVMAVMLFTGMLAYHVAVAPLGGVFARLMPDPGRIARGQTDADLVKMLDAEEMPDIDPGEKAFQKAHELLALGKLDEAREKLTAIVNVYPASASAPIARRIVGEMNLDEVLSTAHMDGKQIHVVKRGDSLLGIAARYRTNIDCIMHLNSMMELPSLQPGDEVVVMPLDFRWLIEPQRKTVSIWQGGRFIREYQALHMKGLHAAAKGTTISSKTATFDGKRVQPQSRNYRAAAKTIQISKPSIRIQAGSAGDEAPSNGIVLQPQDMEEINLLTRVGNEVEIR